MTRSLPVTRAARVAGRAGFIASLVLALGILALPLAGFERYVITGGSMGGTIERGSVAWAKPVPVADLRVGDVITYDPPPGAGPEGLVTHRIVAIDQGSDGRREFRTKGDANARPDPWTFHLDEPAQARVAFHLPYAGYVLAKASDRSFRPIAIGIPAFLVVAATLAGLWR
ncbi:MAG TPA: signal peptidase I, partial [Solirubrobacteraceae bacterium]|nr:signal peptidase I [Solirubrobacteraceae bacterium]